MAKSNKTENQKICEDHLNQRIVDIGNLLTGARNCIAAKNYVQAAVRLESIVSLCNFTDLEQNIFESCSDLNIKEK